MEEGRQQHVVKRRRLLEALIGPAAAAAYPHAEAAQAAHTAPHDEDEDEPELPSDIELAIASLRQQFGAALSPAHAETLPHIVLISQLRTAMRDGTELERGLDDLQRRNVVRVFKLATGLCDCVCDCVCVVCDCARVHGIYCEVPHSMLLSSVWQPPHVLVLGDAHECGRRGFVELTGHYPTQCVCV